METLKHKIDFALVFSVKNAKPNGDPLNGNIPRLTLDGQKSLARCWRKNFRSV